MVKAFGKKDSGSSIGLREFEKYLLVPVREGEGAWRSNYCSVQNLLDHLARFSKSESSRRKYLNLLKNFCKRSSYSPDDLIDLPKEEVDRLVQGFVDGKAKKDCSKRYLNTVIKRLRTFFRVNGIEIDVERYYVPSRYRKRPEYIPSKDEVLVMADATNGPRDRAIILVAWSSGLRVSDLIALKYGDVADDLEKGESYVKTDVCPELSSRVPNACKGGIRYYTFIWPGATEALKTYLRKRCDEHDSIRRDEPLFASKWTLLERKERKKSRISQKTVRMIVKEAAKNAGLSEWEYVTPHCLRKAFQSVLRSSTKDGGTLDKGVQEFLMGHVLPGSQDPYYDRKKIDFHRNEYARLDFSRGTTQTQKDKIVGMDELEDHLEKGWLFVEKIDEDKAVIRKS